MFALLACAEPPPPPAEPVLAAAPAPPADLVLVLLDGVRADLGGAGVESLLRAGAGEPTFAATGGCVQSVHPYLSLGSILTGRYPSAIPLCSSPTNQTEAGSLWCNRVPDSVPTLPEVLGIYGYDTALVATPPGPRELGLLAGEFGEMPAVRGDFDATVTTALDWWNRHGDAPRLLVVTDELLPKLASQVGALGTAPTEDLAAQAQAAYPPLVEARAAQVGRLRAGLGDHGRPTWVFVTSSHGINLGEVTGTASMPDQPVHRDILLERTMHVPLYVYGPFAPASPPAVTPLVDLFPTLAHLAGVLPPAGLVGHDLFGAATPDPVCYAEFGDMLALRTDRHLLMARLWMHGGTALDPEITDKLQRRPDPGSSFTLHDIVADPMQETNLVQTDLEAADRTYRRMLEIRTGPGAPPNGGLSPDQVAALRKAGAIGYW